MAPDFFRSLASALSRANLEVVLIGGWAVNEHGFHRLTNDIDFTFVSARKQEMVETLQDVGYAPCSDSQLVTRFAFRERFIPDVDVLWVNEQTQQKLISSSSPMSSLETMKVVGLRDLLSMKLHALKQSRDRREKDLLDIVTLMRHNPSAPTTEEFAELCEKFGPPNIYNELSATWNL